MKKLISLLVSVILVMLTCVTASAAGLAKFNITLVSETDKQAVVTVDFNGGTGFSGFDFEVDLNSERVEIVKAERGEGLKAFQAQADAALAEINPDTDPVKATVALIPAYRNIENKDLFVITLKKLSADPLTNDDFKIIITNCVDASLQPIETSLTTDLQGVASDDTTTDVTSTESTEASTDASTSANTSEITDAVEGTSGDEVEIEPNAPDAEEVPDEKDNGSKGIVVAIASVVFVAVVGGITYVVLKKKKTPESENGNEEE